MRLFDRTRRSVALTAAGRLLYDEARGLLDHAERVRKTIEASQSGVAGRLSIGSVPSAVFGVLPSILVGLRVLYPRIEIAIKEAHTATILDRVADGTVDAGLVWDSNPISPLAAKPVWRGAFVAAIPADHPLAERESVLLNEVADEPLIFIPRPIAPQLYDTMIAAFASSRLTPNIAHETAPVISMIGFVANGLGIALVPRFMTALPIPQVAYLPVVGLDPMELCLVWNDQATPAVATSLKDSIVAL